MNGLFLGKFEQLAKAFLAPDARELVAAKRRAGEMLGDIIETSALVEKLIQARNYDEFIRFLI